LLAAAFSLVAAREAAAFCRTRTCEFRSDMPCPVDARTGCSQSGAYVYWKSGCISYAVQRDGSPKEQISAQQVADLLDEGFGVWSDVSCPQGGTPELATARQGLIACDQVEFNCMARDQNSNLVMSRDRFVSAGSALQPGVIALTTVTANLVNGEIFDADIEINSRDEDFYIDTRDASGESRNLRGVINHELGHLLGLSHSKVSGALMRALYEGTTAPSTDDSAGICEALDSGGSDPACSVEALDSAAQCLGSDSNCTTIAGDAPPESSGGCSCREARSQPSGPAAWAWAAGLGLWVLRRKSQARQSVL
jgi:MYXO-CTERM domain-containing protein